MYYGPYEEVSKTANAHAMEYLHEVGHELHRQKRCSVEERLLHGHTAEAIVDIAKEAPETLVAMTTHGRSGGRTLALRERC